MDRAHGSKRNANAPVRIHFQKTRWSNRDVVYYAVLVEIFYKTVPDMAVPKFEPRLGVARRGGGSRH